MIGAAILTGLVLPFIIWIVLGVWFWPLCWIGGAILIVFAILFAIEMHQDNGEIPYYIKTLKDTIPFDEKTQYPVIKSSICTGERIAGFRDKNGNGFVEVLVIHNEKEKEMFLKIYGFTEVKTEY